MKTVLYVSLVTLMSFSSAKAFIDAKSTIDSCDRVMVIANEIIDHLKTLKTSHLDLRKLMNEHLKAAHKTNEALRQEQTNGGVASASCQTELESLRADAANHTQGSKEVKALVGEISSLDTRGFTFRLLMEEAIYYAKALLR